MLSSGSGASDHWCRNTSPDLVLGNLVLIDPDEIESSNLSRVVGATRVDVETGQLKTQIAVRHAREMATHATLQPVVGDVSRHSVAQVLRDCDFIFLAADSMRARLVVNALAHQYLIPAIQMGAKIRQGDCGNLEDAMCAVRHIRPGTGCLWCNGLIDPTQLAIEAKSDRERKEQAYGVQEPQPQRDYIERRRRRSCRQRLSLRLSRASNW